MIRRAVLNAALAVVLLVTLALSWVTTDARRPNFEVLPDMAHSPRANAFAANGEFANGATLQIPPPGSIPRGFMPLHYSASPQDAIRAGQELTNPNAPDNQRARQRGAFVFANFCAECHGATATGNGPVIQRGYPAPPSLLTGKAVSNKDGQLFHILTYGQNNMPSYASQISRQDRWDVITYVRSLQAAQPQTAHQQVREQQASGATGGKR
jgi:mono/diheme cytochrome c family protein